MNRSTHFRVIQPPGIDIKRTIRINNKGIIAGTVVQPRVNANILTLSQSLFHLINSYLCSIIVFY